jgi:exodeoxyribonuclease V alpha subunit
MTYKDSNTGTPTERLSGSVERVTFNSEESGFCVLRVKVKGRRELVIVIGSAASITPGEYVECVGTLQNDKTHGLQFKSTLLKVVQSGAEKASEARRDKA